MKPESSKTSPHPTSPSPLLPETASAQDSALELSLSESHRDGLNPPPNTQNFQNDYEREEPFDDHDSAFGGSLIGCDTDTLASYITDYRYENGRRYHAYQDGEYWVRVTDMWYCFDEDTEHLYIGPERRIFE